MTSHQSTRKRSGCWEAHLQPRRSNQQGLEKNLDFLNMIAQRLGIHLCWSWCLVYTLRCDVRYQSRCSLRFFLKFRIDPWKIEKYKITIETFLILDILCEELKSKKSAQNNTSPFLYDCFSRGVLFFGTPCINQIGVALQACFEAVKLEVFLSSSHLSRLVCSVNEQRFHIELNRLKKVDLISYCAMMKIGSSKRHF